MKSIIKFMLLSIFITSLQSCEVVGGIFKAGMVWGIILVVGIIALIVFLITRGKK